MRREVEVAADRRQLRLRPLAEVEEVLKLPRVPMQPIGIPDDNRVQASAPISSSSRLYEAEACRLGAHILIDVTLSDLPTELPAPRNPRPGARRQDGSPPDPTRSEHRSSPNHSGDIHKHSHGRASLRLIARPPSDRARQAAYRPVVSPVRDIFPALLSLPGPPVASVAERHGPGGPAGLQNLCGVVTPRSVGSTPAPLRQAVSGVFTRMRPRRPPGRRG